LIAFVLIYLLGLFSFEYYIWFKKTWARWRAFVFKRTANQTWSRLKENWDILVSQIANIAN
jgi:hypothetical protein